MIKVAYLISRAMKSGPINQSFNILKGLKKLDDIDVVLVTFDKEIEGDSWLDRFLSTGIKVHQFNLTSRNVFKAALKLRQYVSKEKIDIVHGCGTRVDLIMYLSGVRAKKIITHRSYPDMIAEGEPSLLRKLIVPLYLHVMKCMDAVVACSYSMQKAFKTQCDMKLDVIQNAVDTERFTPLDKNEKKKLRRKLGINDIPTFLVLGTLRPRKNNSIIIDAINQYAGFNGQVLFVGSGPEEAFLREKSKNNDRIIFYGSTLNPLDYLQISDYLISASLSEGLPNSVLEAISCGLIPILSNIEPHLEIVCNTSIGFTFNPRNSQELLSRLKKVTMYNQDELSRYARVLAINKFGIDSMTLKYESEYKKLLNI